MIILKFTLISTFMICKIACKEINDHRNDEWSLDEAIYSLDKSITPSKVKREAILSKFKNRIWTRIV